MDFAEKRSVLVVDDTPENLSVISGILREHFKVRVAPSGERALQIALSDEPPDLILLDIMMPEMDGYEVLRRLQAAPKTADIPVLFVTAMDQEQDEQLGIDLGAVDYITKPVSPPILLARVRNHLMLKEARDYLKDEKRFLERQLAAIQNVAIHAFASLAETHDDETVNHVRRMQHYVKTLAEQLKGHPRFAAAFTDEAIDLIVKSVPLHDIGKVGIPTEILLKSGSLEPDEFEVMKTHTTIGRDAIVRAQQVLGADAEFLRYAREIVHSHHEKWDGTGYPQGLRGEAIPIAARLVAVADMYDVLISRRPHKPPLSHEESSEIVLSAKGTNFDPDIVDAFASVQNEFSNVAARFVDSESIVKAKMARRRET
ncbi:MAG: response regulator [Betaproteobacteria bacterium]|nr:MAG: response regulator [Betaproteobacteria bacterium]